jgi:hypothetical protein
MNGDRDSKTQTQDFLQQTLPEDSGRGFWWELGGLLALMGIVGGYWVAQELQVGPILLTAKPTPSLQPSSQPKVPPEALIDAQGRPLPLPPGGLVMPSQKPKGDINSPTPLRPEQGGTGQPALDATAEIYQRTPESGTYFPQDPTLGDARREIASQQGRICMKLVMGAGQSAPAPSGTAPGASQAQTGSQTVISSMSLRNDGIYLDATGEKLGFDRSYTVLRDRSGTWQRLQNSADRDGAMGECLAAQTPYIKAIN